MGSEESKLAAEKIEEGSRVEVEGLKGAKKRYNGRIGKVEGKTPQSECIILFDDGTRLNLKPEFLKPAEPEPEAVEDPNAKKGKKKKKRRADSQAPSQADDSDGVAVLVGTRVRAGSLASVHEHLNGLVGTVTDVSEAEDRYMISFEREGVECSILSLAHLTPVDEEGQPLPKAAAKADSTDDATDAAADATAAKKKKGGLIIQDDEADAAEKTDVPEAPAAPEGFVVGCGVVIASGPHEGLGGKITALLDDGASCTVALENGDDATVLYADVTKVASAKAAEDIDSDTDVATAAGLAVGSTVIVVKGKKYAGMKGVVAEADVGGGKCRVTLEDGVDAAIKAHHVTVVPEASKKAAAAPAAARSSRAGSEPPVIPALPLGELAVNTTCGVPAAPAAALKVGTRVTIAASKKHADLAGRVGTITAEAADDSSAKCVVKVDGVEEPVALKPALLTIADAPAAADADTPSGTSTPVESSAAKLPPIPDAKKKGDKEKEKSGDTAKAGTTPAPLKRIASGTKVEIKGGMKKRPEVVGQIATAMEMTPRCERWVVALDNGEQVAVKEGKLAAVAHETAPASTTTSPTNPPLTRIASGIKVEIKGMKKRPEVNGQIATAVDMTPRGERWLVQLEDGQQVAVKEPKLSVVEEAEMAVAGETASEKEQVAAATDAAAGAGTSPTDVPLMRIASGIKVEISGMKKRPEVNGQIGTAVEMTPRCERWVVALDNGEQVAVKQPRLRVIDEGEATPVDTALALPAASAANTQLTAGCAVVIGGLKKHGDMNGKTGVAVSLSADKDRWVVRLNDAAADSEEILLKPQYLKVVEADADAGGATPATIPMGAEVRIATHKKRPELVGRTGTAEAFSKEDGRWLVKLTGDDAEDVRVKAQSLEVVVKEKETETTPATEEATVQASPLTIARGQRVAIAGLKKHADINGKEGVAKELSEEGDRWVVAVDGGDEVLLKPQYLTPLAAEVGAGADAGEQVVATPHEDAAADTQDAPPLTPGSTVAIQGVKKHAEVNGKTGIVVASCDDGQRWVVKVGDTEYSLRRQCLEPTPVETPSDADTQNTTTASESSPRVAIVKGDSVMITGPKKRADLHGKVGVAQERDAAEDRWTVVLKNGDAVLIKAIYLSPVTVEQPAGAGKPGAAAAAAGAVAADALEPAPAVEVGVTRVKVHSMTNKKQLKLNGKEGVIIDTIDEGKMWLVEFEDSTQYQLTRPCLDFLPEAAAAAAAEDDKETPTEAVHDAETTTAAEATAEATAALADAENAEEEEAKGETSAEAGNTRNEDIETEAAAAVAATEAKDGESAAENEDAEGKGEAEGVAAAAGEEETTPEEAAVVSPAGGPAEEPEAEQEQEQEKKEQEKIEDETLPAATEVEEQEVEVATPTSPKAVAAVDADAAEEGAPADATDDAKDEAEATEAREDEEKADAAAPAMEASEVVSVASDDEAEAEAESGVDVGDDKVDAPAADAAPDASADREDIADVATPRGADPASEVSDRDAAAVAAGEEEEKEGERKEDHVATADSDADDSDAEAEAATTAAATVTTPRATVCEPTPEDEAIAALLPAVAAFDGLPATPPPPAAEGTDAGSADATTGAEDDWTTDSESEGEDGVRRLPRAGGPNSPDVPEVPLAGVAGGAAAAAPPRLPPAGHEPASTRSGGSTATGATSRVSSNYSKEQLLRLLPQYASRHEARRGGGADVGSEASTTAGFNGELFARMLSMIPPPQSARDNQPIPPLSAKSTPREQLAHKISTIETNIHTMQTQSLGFLWAMEQQMQTMRTDLDHLKRLAELSDDELGMTPGVTPNPTPGRVPPAAAAPPGAAAAAIPHP